MSSVAEVEYVSRGKALGDIIRHYAKESTTVDVEAMFLEGIEGFNKKTDDELTEVYNKVLFKSEVYYKVYTDPPGDALLYKTTLALSRFEVEDKIMHKFASEKNWDFLLMSFTTLLFTGFKGMDKMEDEELAKFCMDVCYKDQKIKVTVLKSGSG